jgi:DNA-binding transcriptional ArsR family regulator
MSNQTADAVFDALGEPVRRRILELLRDGPTPVGQLAERLPVGRPAVSKHLRVLSNAGLIEHRSAGTRNLYMLVPGGMASAQQWLTRTWDTVLAAYAAEVSRLGQASRPAGAARPAQAGSLAQAARPQAARPQAARPAQAVGPQEPPDGQPRSSP